MRFETGDVGLHLFLDVDAQTWHRDPWHDYQARSTDCHGQGNDGMLEHSSSKGMNGHSQAYFVKLHVQAEVG